MLLVRTPPVAVMVPVIASLPRIDELLATVRPVPAPLRVVSPLTPSVPPIVALLVTAKELKVPAPVLVKVVNLPVPGVTAPMEVAVKSPPIIILPPTVAFTETPRLPVTVVLPFRLTAPEPVEKLVAPVWLKLPEVVIGPTAKLEVPKLAEVREVAVKVVPLIVTLPPKVAKPVPTVKVLVPVTPVLPLRLTAPVPVEKVPVPT